MHATTFSEEIICHAQDFWLFATTILGYCHDLNDRVSENISDEKLTIQSGNGYLPPPRGLVICPT